MVIMNEMLLSTSLTLPASLILPADRAALHSEGCG